MGFAEGKELRLGEVTIQLACPYASLFLTALDRNVTLADAKSALLCAVARNSNSGFKYFAIDSRTLDNGRGPILLEPVKSNADLLQPKRCRSERAGPRRPPHRQVAARRRWSFHH